MNQAKQPRQRRSIKDGRQAVYDIDLDAIPPKINDDIDRRINDYAFRAFRDIADKDYITARMAEHAELMHQFLWCSQQAVEKYLKCILLLNRIPARDVRHNITSAPKLTKQLPFELDLSERTSEFIDHLSNCSPTSTSDWLRKSRGLQTS
jgi:hypothetical protein